MQRFAGANNPTGTGADRICPNSNRQGMVLVVVLMVIILLSLAAYSYTDSMVSEHEATMYAGRRAQSRAFAESGIENMAANLDGRTFEADENFYHNPEFFFQQQMRTAENARGTGYYTIIVANDRDPNGVSVRYGFASESGKVDLNNLITLEETLDGEAEMATEDDALTDTPAIRDLMMFIPNMTEEIADSILDWIDEDDESREYGAESEYYQTLSSPYSAPNAPIESMDELLRIKGITPQLLYGEDVNRNGLLDPNENDAELTAPDYDNGDGILDRGLAHYLTIFATESNLNAEGEEKIYLNNDVSADLFDAVEEKFSETEAQFIVAFRIYGSLDAVAAIQEGDLSDQQEAVVTNVATGIAGSPDGTVTRAGLDLLQTPQYKINSVFDLIDAEVEAEVDGQSTTLTSPWTSANLITQLPELYDAFSASEDPIITGRIDPNHATAAALMTIPDGSMTENLAESIASASVIGNDGNVLSELIAQRATPGWLYIEQLVDLPTMRILAPYLTTRGSVYRAQVLGYFGEGGPMTRLEAVIDATEVPAAILSVTDMTKLEKGYSRQHLQTTSEDP